MNATTRPFCTDACRRNGGWLLDTDGYPIGRCRCRLNPALVETADAWARERRARYDPDEGDD